MNSAKFPQREVFIVTVFGTHFVRYKNRQYRKHWNAAQFLERDHTLDQVKEWIKSKPLLKLINEPREPKPRRVPGGCCLKYSAQSGQCSMTRSRICLTI